MHPLALPRTPYGGNRSRARWPWPCRKRSISSPIAKQAKARRHWVADVGTPSGSMPIAMRTPPVHPTARSRLIYSPVRADPGPQASEPSAAAPSAEAGPSEAGPSEPEDLEAKRANAVAQASAEGLILETSEGSGSGYKSVRKREPRRGHGMRTTFEARIKRQKSWATLGVFATAEEAALEVARKRKATEERAEANPLAPAAAPALPPRKRPRD